MTNEKINLCEMSKENEPLPEKSPPEEKKEESISQVFTNAASNTVTNGIPNIFRTQSPFRKIAWTVIVICGFGVLIWQVTTAVIKFKSYPTTTTFTIGQSSEQQFPAVTMCNNNPYMYNKVMASNTDLKVYLEEQNNEFTAATSNIVQPSSFDDWTVSTSRTVDSSYTDTENFLLAANNLTRGQKLSFGYTMADMIITCSFNGNRCTARDFTFHNNYLYGNCFTFNSGNENDIVSSSKIGPLNGLTMEFYIIQDEYIPSYSDAAGMRVVIHNQTSMPFPEVDGMSIGPGLSTMIGVTKRTVVRAEQPYGKCKTYTNDENKKINAYLEELDYIHYSSSACLKTCLQRHLMKDCHCYDYAFPHNINTSAYSDIKVTKSIQACAADWDTTETCSSAVSAKFINNSLGCHDECLEPCMETKYDSTLSSSLWPSTAAEDQVVYEVANTDQALWTYMYDSNLTADQRSKAIRDNVLRVKIFYRDLNAELVTTVASYKMFDLISDLGGQAGLWLGVSMVAFFELFELLFDVSVLLYVKCKKKQKVGGDNSQGGEKDKIFYSRTDTKNDLYK